MKVRSTTIVALRRDGITAMASDGQVSIGDTIFKQKTVKLRTMRDGKWSFTRSGPRLQASTRLAFESAYLPKPARKDFKPSV